MSQLVHFVVCVTAPNLWAFLHSLVSHCPNFWAFLCSFARSCLKNWILVGYQITGSPGFFHVCIKALSSVNTYWDAETITEPRCIFYDYYYAIWRLWRCHWPSFDMQLASMEMQLASMEMQLASWGMQLIRWICSVHLLMRDNNYETPVTYPSMNWRWQLLFCCKQLRISRKKK